MTVTALKAYRLRARLTQWRLAEKSGVDLGRLARHELGSEKLTTVELIKIGKALQIAPRLLVGRVEWGATLPTTMPAAINQCVGA